jgi:hypothetical protein
MKANPPSPSDLKDGAPESTATQKRITRIRLQCSGCKAFQFLQLDPLDARGSEVNAVQQYCSTCSGIMYWERVDEAPQEVSAPPAPEPEKQASKAAPGRVANRRKHGRIKSNALACIREQGLPDDVCTCEDLSRGGLRLRTSRAYLKGKRIEVAVPYSKTGENIFVSARIVRVKQLGSFYELGIEYAKNSEKKPQQSGGYSGSAPTGFQYG